jgi:hypothetical protein
VLVLYFVLYVLKTASTVRPPIWSRFTRPVEVLPMSFTSPRASRPNTSSSSWALSVAAHSVVLLRVAR